MLNNTLHRKVILALVLTSCVVTNIAKAQPGGQSGKRYGPPPEALEACSNSSEGDSCSFSGRRGDNVDGTCIVPRSDDGLACAPEGGPPADHEGKGAQENSD
jgi:hypothetical protein